MHPTFKFIHLRAQGITIGYRINDENQTVTYAASFTSTRDTFNKAIGREIVTGRILKGGTKKNGVDRSHTFFLDAIGGSTKYADVSKHIINEVMSELPYYVNDL